MREREEDRDRERAVTETGRMDGWTHLWEGVFVCVFLYARVHKIHGKFAERFSFLLALPIKKKSE